MKFNTSDLSRGNQRPQGEPPAPPYRKGECTLTQANLNSNAVSARAKSFVKFQGWDLVLTLQSALDLRRQGRKVMTPREADIAARQNIDLKEHGIEDMLLDGYVLNEGAVLRSPDTVYEKRRFYNQICNALKKLGDRATPEQLAKKQEVLAWFKSRGLQVWPEEEVDGFPEEMLRPEFMTFSQYQEAAKREIAKVENAT